MIWAEEAGIEYGPEHEENELAECDSNNQVNNYLLNKGNYELSVVDWDKNFMSTYKLRHFK